VCSVEWPLELPVFELVPSTSQVVFEGDKFPLECHVAESDTEMNVTWIHDNEAVKMDRERGLLLHTRRLPGRTRITTVVIERLNAESDAGNWTCHVTTMLGTSELSVEIIVLSRKTIYCPPEVTNSNRGRYVWPSTIAGTEQMIPCIAGGAPDLDGSIVASAQRICDEAGNWKDADASQCRYVSKTTQALEDYLLVSMQKTCIYHAYPVTHVLLKQCFSLFYFLMAWCILSSKYIVQHGQDLYFVIYR